MKIQMIVHMKNDDGTLGAESTTIEVDVPNYEAFTGPEQFGEVFDQYERKVLEARKEVREAATEKYLDAMSKKLGWQTGCAESLFKSSQVRIRISAKAKLHASSLVPVL